jgi:predicted O-methyltransferase YrrM
MSLADRIAAATSRAHLYLYRRYATEARRNRPFELVWERAARDSADFIYENMADAVIFRDRVEFWRHVLRQLPPEGQLLEVGVFQGLSINMIADDRLARGDSRLVHGFDSFEGLEEDWSGEALPAGFFNQGGRLPGVRSNVRLHKGWVQDTLAPFMASADDKRIALLHIDTDTYTPARYTLDAAAPFLGPGSIIVFDELIGYPNWQQHEYKALGECLSPDRYRFIGFTSRQAAIRLV